MLHLSRSIVYAVSQSPNAKLTLDSIDYLFPLFLFIYYFFLPCSLFFYPIKVSCLLLHCAILWTLGNGDCLLHEMLKFVLLPKWSLIIFNTIKRVSPPMCSTYTWVCHEDVKCVNSSSLILSSLIFKMGIIITISYISQWDFFLFLFLVLNAITFRRCFTNWKCYVCNVFLPIAS